ncbi:MAG: hypothetical protein GX938_09845 [Spirochaetales bacterium]|nr:hypothetical protein [Spirochaetales bacterium]
MPKEIILYNLAPGVTHEEYARYVKEKKGPFFEGLIGVKKFTLVRMVSSKTETLPFQYVGIVELSNLEEWRRETASPAFATFMKEWTGKVSDFYILSGEEVY